MPDINLMLKSRIFIKAIRLERRAVSAAFIFMANAL